MLTHWRWLRAPHPLEAPRVAFAGEFCSDSYNQCVDGAKGLPEQRLPQGVEPSSNERERLQQQHRNRRQQAAVKEPKAATASNRPLRGVKKYKKEMLGATQAKARIVAARAGLKEANVAYCGEECCPVGDDCLDSSHAGFYLTDGSDMTDWDEAAAETGEGEDRGESVYGENTRLMLEKFQALLRYNHKQLNLPQARCSPRSSAPAGFAQPAQARAS